MLSAAYEEVIAVAATDQNDVKAYFSNWGDWIELAAPGLVIYSTMPTYPVTLNEYPYGYSMNYDFMNGTSMACPM
jgi:thermitase